MKGKDSNENKGYAFVTFRTKDLASQAIKELNNSELKVETQIERRIKYHKIIHFHISMLYDSREILIGYMKVP